MRTMAMAMTMALLLGLMPLTGVRAAEGSPSLQELGEEFELQAQEMEAAQEEELVGSSSDAAGLVYADAAHRVLEKVPASYAQRLLYVPESVQRIAAGAFSEAKVTEVDLPVSVTQIDAGAFAGAKNLSLVYYRGTRRQWESIGIGENNQALKDAQLRICRFDDVRAGTYYYGAVSAMAWRGYVSGTDSYHFSPSAPCTRGQFVTILYRMIGQKTGGTSPFSDVREENYFHDAVLWAVQQKITSGTTQTTFSPNAACTRAQAITFLWRAQGSPVVGGSNPFKDVSEKAYYYQAVLWAVKSGITSGTSDTAFSPNTTCTRAQASTFLFRGAGVK